MHENICKLNVYVAMAKINPEKKILEILCASKAIIQKKFSFEDLSYKHED